MLKAIIRRTICAALAAAFLLTAPLGCGGAAVNQPGGLPGFASYLQIPGISESEINAIEALRGQYVSFVYAVTPGAEAFIGQDGKIHGYSALFCDWLTNLFGIAFQPALYPKGGLNADLADGKIDFTDEIPAENKPYYYMTGAIAERSVKTFRLEGSEPLSDIEIKRPLRIGFLEGSSIYKQVVESHAYTNYETVFLSGASQVYDALESGRIDVFIDVGSIEQDFDAYGNITVQDIFPPIYQPIMLSSTKPALQPIISVVQKALLSGGDQYLSSLYDKGYQEYLKNKLYTQLSGEEQAYISNHPIVPVAAEFDNYPVSFYNTNDKAWQGIFFDILQKVKELTGLSFEVVNNQNTSWPDLLSMLSDGKASVISELVWSKDIENQYLWPKTAFMSDNYALVSRSDFRDISINEIPFVKVGLIKDTVRGDMFRNWFPSDSNTVDFDNSEDAINALTNNEIDMIMSTQRRLLILTNFREMPNYKANYIFDCSYQSSIGFNKDETILCSVFNKALKLINTKELSNQWVGKTYDYRLKLAQAQTPWLIGVAVLFLCVLILLLVLFLRNRNEGKKLESLVQKRTAELSESLIKLEDMQWELKAALETAEAASNVKTTFLANTSHEMRTPLNVVVGLTDLMLEELGPNDEIIQNLWKINNAGITLLGIVNDILDISKIEAGKLTLAPVDYDVASLLNDTITLNILRIGDKPITFHLDIDDDLPSRLYGDDLRVKQLLNNLLSNAFKYTREGRVVLGCYCEPAGDKSVWLDVYVSDTGIGIKPDDLEKLFSEYNQVDIQANRKIEGTGLGLSITKKLTELMGGSIGVESKYGKGSVFYMRVRQGVVSEIPIGPVVSENLRSFRFSEKKSVVAAKLVRIDLSYARVLVVDDVQTNLDVAMGLMRKYKMQVDTAASGREAVNRVSYGAPVYDAIFMDHMMPGMDGIEATQKIRAIGTEYAAKVPIIALTANAIVGNENMFIENGFQAFLSKPIDIMLLDSVLRKWVRDKSKEELLPSVRPASQPSQIESAQADVTPDINIPGVNAEKGLALFGGDREAYVSVLRSYAANTPGIIGGLRSVTKESLPDYAVNVHGLKGSSGSIGAEDIRKRAAVLEEMAKSGDLPGVLSQNEGLLNDAESLICGIQAWLDRAGAANAKPVLHAPERAILARLRECCENYDMDGVDRAMGELEGANYETDADLVTWLREKIDGAEFSEAAERLAEYEG